jgi:hypothetical protein
MGTNKNCCNPGNQEQKKDAADTGSRAYAEKKYTQFADTEKERRRAIETERKLSAQDEIMWDHNDGISQLEGRIATDSFQG